MPEGPWNSTAVPLQTGELEVQMQSGVGMMETSSVHSFEQPSLVTVTLSLVVPDDPAVKVIDWVLLAEVITPLVIDQA